MTDRAEAVNDALRRPETSAAREPDLFQLFESSEGGHQTVCLSREGRVQEQTAWRL